MLKRLALWKYGATVIFILGGCIYVTCQDQATRDQYEQKCTQLNASRTVPPSEHQEDCDKGAENAARHLPRWYRIFGWPEGITTWAILLTLIAIAEQTSETRRAAQATQTQAEISRKAFISQYRPKVIVRTMWLTEINGKLLVEIWMTNTGDTPAHITGGSIMVGWRIPAESKKTILSSETIQSMSVPPGGDNPLVADITKIAAPYGVARIAVNEMGREQEAWIYCFGTVSYADDNGTKRSTGFLRKYDIKRERFIPSDDPEEEYAD